jgi:hypothetical protein
MAFSNTYDTVNTGSAVSNREDLADYVSILAPEETPVLSSATKSKAKATFHEWTVDSLDPVSTDGTSEGADVTEFSDKYANRARLGNYVQHLRKSFKVSRLQEAVDSVGPAAFAGAETKASRELKRNVEATLISNNNRQAEDGAGNPYKLRGFGNWVDSAGPSDVPALYRTPAGSIHASSTFTEVILGNLITSIYRVNGFANGLTLVADTALRRLISGFAKTDTVSNAIRTFNQDSASKKIVLAVEVYMSDHGQVDIVNMNPDTAPDTINKDTGYLINPDYYEVAELVSMGSERLPDLGGGPRGFVDWTGTLVVKHPGAHGKITTLS